MMALARHCIGRAYQNKQPKLFDFLLKLRDKKRRIAAALGGR